MPKFLIELIDNVMGHHCPAPGKMTLLVAYYLLRERLAVETRANGQYAHFEQS